mgnify:CR=1 FL=1
MALLGLIPEKKTENVAPLVKPEQPQRPRPRIVTPSLSPEEYNNYSELAEKIGFKPSALLESKIEQVLSDMGLQVYSREDVENYMNRKADEAEKTWEWYALRRKDVEKVGYSHFQFNRRSSWYSGEKSYGECMKRPYQKAVPLHILQWVKEIEERVDDERLGFYVSDYSDPRPDPFIFVAGGDLPMFVFGVWDEPEFFSNAK